MHPKRYQVIKSGLCPASRRTLCAPRTVGEGCIPLPPPQDMGSQDRHSRQSGRKYLTRKGKPWYNKASDGIRLIEAPCTEGVALVPPTNRSVDGEPFNQAKTDHAT